MILNLSEDVRQCNKIIQLRDTEMDDILSEMEIMRKQIIVLRYNLEERNAYVFPLKDELKRMEMTIDSVSTPIVKLNEVFRSFHNNFLKKIE